MIFFIVCMYVDGAFIDCEWIEKHTGTLLTTILNKILVFY